MSLLLSNNQYDLFLILNGTKRSVTSYYYFIKLSNNNKTNTLIESQYLYIMLKHSIIQKLFIALPSPNKELKFNILNSFS